MNSGSCFLAEIARTTSSFRPAGSASASMSLTKPHLYSRVARASSVFAVVLMSALLLLSWPPAAPLGGERRAAAAARLGAGVDERESAREPLLHVVERDLVQVEVALLVADHAHPVDLEFPIVEAELAAELEHVRHPRAAAALHPHPEEYVIPQVLGLLQLLHLLRCRIRYFQRHRSVVSSLSSFLTSPPAPPARPRR